MYAGEFYNRAAVPLEKAIVADEKKDYATAKFYYSRACELLLMGIRMDHDQRKREQKISQIQNFLSRAELISGKTKGKERAANSLDESNGQQKGFVNVAGLEHIKQSMREAVILPLLQPQVFTGKRTPWKGVLLFGPPGTGKSYITEALSHEANVEFLSISSSDIMSKWQGESEKAVRALFEKAARKKPAVIFIDEVDSIGGSRENVKGDSSTRLLTEILRQMDGVGSSMEGITVIAATNHPETIDSALRRRFEKRLYVPLPGAKTRLQLFKLNFGSDPALHCLSKKDMRNLARRTKGYSGADIANVVNEAMMIPIRKLLKATHFKEQTDFNWRDAFDRMGMKVLVPCRPNDPKAKPMRILDKNFPSKLLKVPPVNYGDVLDALKKIKPSVSTAEVKHHEEFARKFAGTDYKDQIESEDLEEEVEEQKSSFLGKLSTFLTSPSQSPRKRPLLS